MRETHLRWTLDGSLLASTALSSELLFFELSLFELFSRGALAQISPPNHAPDLAPNLAPKA